MLQQHIKPLTTSTAAERRSITPSVFPTLKLMRNGTTIQELSLDLPQILIGRNDDNDISIPSPYVSKQHILLVRWGGSTILIDLDSTNGTFVNAERVYNHVLVHNDVITIDNRSMFVNYQIQYSEPSAIADRPLDDVEVKASDIDKVVAGFENLLIGGDTDLLPELSEDVPTIVGVIDDR
jgi:pSer/pThr/pTyr-binding forkhead associated (FHA) protein